jgi:hypothetical protein
LHSALQLLICRTIFHQTAELHHLETMAYGVAAGPGWAKSLLPH